jgi:hypothetical protein
MRRLLCTWILVFALPLATAEGLHKRIVRALTVLGPTATVALLHFSTHAEAAIRIIGKGGGYAEMVALTLLSRVGEVAKTCESSCGLNNEETRILSELRERDLLNTRSAKIEFFSDAQSEDEVRYYEDSSIGISSRHIYLSDQRPAPLVVIAELVMQAWLMRPEVVQVESGANLQTLARKLAQRIVVRQHHFRAGALQVHVFDVQGGAGVFVELNGDTRDVSAELAQKICDGRPGTLLSSSDFHQEGTNILGQAKALCEDEIHGARVVVNSAGQLIVLQRQQICVKNLELR